VNQPHLASKQAEERAQGFGPVVVVIDYKDAGMRG
jgi:hypothetical protein